MTDTPSAPPHGPTREEIVKRVREIMFGAPLGTDLKAICDMIADAILRLVEPWMRSILTWENYRRDIQTARDEEIAKRLGAEAEITRLRERAERAEAERDEWKAAAQNTLEMLTEKIAYVETVLKFRRGEG